ncbi:MAG: zinc-binding dehydrogenase [Chryseobacterium sp.]
MVENILNANKNKAFDFGVDLVGNYMSEITAEVLKINGTYVDVTALTTNESREMLFNKGNLIINISNYSYSMTKNYQYYKDSLNEISRLIEHEIITPPNYKIMGNLSLETVLKAHYILKNNQTQGNKLIMTHE